ncbi:hypothetical protein CTAYLR_006554 [Chrysophaeum taylorii]|uniref:Uncharacterized protein n=1 Tax=Chrysophaeum taylorii TaxID=2483200 RepID=A0AAD7UHC4_9STRA|nr:hypothetical protein CTAYLR_006554 [Chrysophaeum taylorii]
MEANAVPRRRTEECPAEVPVYEVGSDDDTRYGSHLGSYVNPITITAGCPYALDLAPGKAIYLSATGFSIQDQFGNLPMLYHGWSVDSDHDETPVSLFSFRQRPVYREEDAGTGYDWYWWPLLHEDVVAFHEDSSGNDDDFYHCYGGCGYSTSSCSTCGTLDLRTLDELMITVSTYSAANTIIVTQTTDLSYPSTYILPAELDVIRELYMTMCHPYADAPDDWSWATHQTVDSDLSGEKDSRRKPYCDWWPTIEPEEIDALTETDCLVIPGVRCDSDGHVSDLILDTKGIRGPFPASFAQLTHLQYLELPNNRINGTLPTNLFGSSTIKKIDLYNNLIEGNLRCPNETDSLSLLKTLSIARNRLTGEVPTCFFTNLPELSTLDLSRNALEATIPMEVNEARKLTALYLERSGIRGTLYHITNLSSMSNLDLSHNFIEGNIRKEFLSAMPRLYHVDLSWNELNGTLPTIDSNPTLRLVDLSHNMFDGTISDQFVPFAANQDRGVSSKLDLSDNMFCGPLPTTFYDLIMDSHYFVYNLDVSNNHFRCSVEGNNMYFENWVSGIAHDFGKCIPIPEIRGYEMPAGTLAPGTEVIVTGSFVPTTEGSCKIEFETQVYVVTAVFYSRSRVGCTVPAEAPVGVATITVAHYCDDYASEDTLAGFEPVQISVESATDSTTALRAVETSSKKKGESSATVVAWAVVAVFLAIFSIVFICYTLCRERSGNPIIKPHLVENPIHSGIGSAAIFASVKASSSVSDDDQGIIDHGIDLQIDDEPSAKVL